MTTVGTLMAGIDTRIIIVGLPSVARALGADVESIVWGSHSYPLASTVALLLIGRITDVVGRLKIYNLITTAIPHAVFSNPNPAALGQLPDQEFIAAFKVAAFVFAFIDTLAILPSFLRGSEKEQTDGDQLDP